MKYFTTYLCLLFVISGAQPAQALPGSARQVFDHINGCVKRQNLAPCHDDLTASSIPLFDRFVSYHLEKCLPDDVTQVSEKRGGDMETIRAQTNITGQPRFMRLQFVNEEERWKFDIPGSLQTGMGPDWQQQVNNIEQIYLTLRAQLGNNLNCQMVRGLAHR